MADKRIEDATPDTQVTGVEKLPVSDAGVAKCMTVAQVKDYTLAQIAAIAEASGIDLSADGIYLLKGGALKPVSSETLATAVLDYGFGKVAVASMNGNEIVGVKDSTAQKTITVAQLKTWLQANMTVTTDIDIGAKDAAGALSAGDLLVIAQSGTNKKLTLTTLTAYVHAAFKDYVVSLTAVTTIANTDVIYLINGTEAKKCTIAKLMEMVGGGNVIGPDTTTNNKIPQWDSAAKTLKDGLEVQGTVRASGTASTGAIPTEAAVRAAVEERVEKVTGKGLSTNDYSDAEKAKVAALSDASIAPWVANKTYAVGDHCVQGGFIRRCITAGSAATFNPAWWEYIPSYPTTDASTKYLRGDGSWAALPSFVGATSATNGTSGLVPAPTVLDKDKFLKGNGEWGVVDGASDMTGATSSSGGTHGLVPAPTAGDNDKFLRGDGEWTEIDEAEDMTGATASVAGVHGLVPAPSAGDNEKYLRGDGTWATPSGGGSSSGPGLGFEQITISTDGGVSSLSVSPLKYTEVIYDGSVSTFPISFSTEGLEVGKIYRAYVKFLNSGSAAPEITGSSISEIRIPSITDVSSFGDLFKAETLTILEIAVKCYSSGGATVVEALDAINVNYMKS